MTKATMFWFTACVCLLVSIALSANTAMFGSVVGEAAGMLGLSWAAAGAIYLISGRSIERGNLTYLAVLFAVILAFAAYYGRSWEQAHASKQLDTSGRRLLTDEQFFGPARNPFDKYDTR